MIETQSEDQFAKLLEAFKASLESTQTIIQTSGPESDRVDQALALAAFCGPFDLHRLVQFAPESEQPRLITELLNTTEGLTIKGRRRRLLAINTRRRILADVLKRPGQLEQLLDILPAAREDAEGRVLRKLLCGWRPDLRKLKTERLGTLCVALGWLQGLETVPDINGQSGLSWPEISQVQREQAHRARKAEIRSLLPNGMVGRKTDLRRLCEFVENPATASDIMIITGAGGIGKSTLVAALSATLAARKSPVPVLNFDFDRPSLDLVGPGLSLDLTRQLAQYLPGSVDRLSEARTLVREAFERRGGYSDHKESAETLSVSSMGEASLVIRHEIIDTAFADQPVLVLLDSFEVAAAQGHRAVSMLRDWLAALTYDIGMRSVRTLLIGRAAESIAEPLGVEERAIYRLGPLNQTDAMQLLRQSGLDERRATDAASSLGGNPLVLRLASRYLLEHPEASGKMTFGDENMNETLSQGVLYRRILNRIGYGDDDPLRKLAYPGLALRVVTPKLLNDVLAPIVLKNKHHDREKNKTLFERLAQQVWLVDRETAQRVRHRRDLREITLHLLRNDPVMLPLVNELHAKAIEYYTHARDPDLPAEQAQLELVYHRLMLLPRGEDLPTRDRRLVQVAMAGEFNELPPHAAALARFHSGHRTTTGELKLLPRAYQHRATAEAAWAAIDTGRPEDALTLYQDQRPAPVWYLTALHDTVNWGSYSDYLTRNHGDLDETEPTVQRRESIDEARSVIAFLHLWRGEFHKIASPDNTHPIPRLYQTGSPKLRAAAAWGIAALLERKFNHPGWNAMREMLRSTYKEDRKDALTAKAEARLWLLLWSAGHLTPEDRIPILAESLALSPELSHKLDRLWRGRPAISRTPNPVLKTDLSAPVAVLTGKLAREIESTFKDGLCRGDLEDAGLRPRDFLPGLMTELQPATRLALRSFVTDRERLDIFVHELHRGPNASLHNSAPRDLRREQWLKAASEGDGLRATLPLIDWYGRLGRLSEVCHLAAHLSDGRTSSSLHKLSNAWGMLETAFARESYSRR